MVPTRQTTLRLGLVAAAVVSMSACATKKPTYQAPQTQPPAQQPQRPPEQPPITRNNTPPPVGPLPGTEQDFVVNIGDRVLFDFDSYALRSDAGPKLGQQAAWLKRYPAVQVRIEGSCDERGTREYNLALGARRANTVRDYLISQGIEAGRISTVSYGKEKLTDAGTGDAADQNNRNAHTAIVSGARMR